MKALLIAPDTQSIEEVEVADMDDIKALVGFDTIESDAVGNEGDRLYFDEECFLRSTSGRFRIDKLVPIAGKGVVVGTAEDGVTLRGVATGKDDLSGRITYL